MADNKPPKIVDYVDTLNDKLQEFNQGLNQFHQESYQSGLAKLLKAGKIKKREGELGYDLSALDTDQEAIDMFIEGINAKANDWMRHLYTDFDKWDETRQEEEKIKKLGMNKYTLEPAVKRHGSDYSIEAHLKEHEKEIDHIRGIREQAHFGKIKAKHAKDLFKYSFGIDEDHKHWKKIKWDVLEHDDQYIRSAVANYLRGGKLSDKYFKNAIWYNSS